MKTRLAKLALAIGRECAQREFAWMKRSQHAGDLNLLGMLDRRIAGEPLQYILGTLPFGPLDLLTRPPTLIPRPETEDWAIRLARTLAPSITPPVRVLDLCTGSGCIPLLLCHLWPPASTHAVGVDISPDAVRLAADNTSRSCTHGRQNIFTPLQGDIHDPDLLHHLDPPPPFDVITANPPYIPLHVYHSLPSSVKDYEDPRALIGDPPNASHTDGLSFYRAIAALLARKGVLAPHATIALEVGHDQAHAVVQILRHTPGLPLGPMEIWKDPWDKDRVVFARAV
ncbi:S-adenosyl-L-methionine-dependent methyltransferase [Boletus edulis]|nr:S-adenosyl-L-methionine-dependent methyltransferase [Boletus edulis]